MEIKLLKPFGPSILKAKIPQNIQDKLNNYVDNIIINKKKSEELNMGNKLAGDVTQEIELEKKFMTESGWLKFLANCVKQWIKIDLNKDITKFNLIDSWVVRQFKDEYNPVHWHGGHVSGAGFLKVPETLGMHVQECVSGGRQTRVE